MGQTANIVLLIKMIEIFENRITNVKTMLGNYFNYRDRVKGFFLQFTAAISVRRTKLFTRQIVFVLQIRQQTQSRIPPTQICLFNSSHLILFDTIHLILFNSSHRILFNSSYLILFNSSHLIIFNSSHLILFLPADLISFEPSDIL